MTKSIYNDMKKAKPFIKWVGGTRQLLPIILENIPSDINTYYEPFVGGGALLFNIKAKSYFISDINGELINVYNNIKNNKEELIEILADMSNKYKKATDPKSYYLEIRAWDREDTFSQKTSVERAARFIFLNKTAFNGMWRVNSKGQHNVPFGKMQNPTILDKENIILCNQYLSSVDIEQGSFEQILAK